jgi:hypothetical protein
MSTKPQNNIFVGEVVAASLFSSLLALFDLFRFLNLKRSQSKQAMYCEVLKRRHNPVGGDMLHVHPLLHKEPRVKWDFIFVESCVHRLKDL